MTRFLSLLAMHVLRVMPDTMVFDFIVADSELLAKVQDLVPNGQLDLLTTHVQEDQLREIPDPVKAAAIAAVPRRQIPTQGFVVDISRVDAARLTESGKIEELRKGNLRHSEDALIGATADLDADALVTDDQTLTKRARAQGTTVWTMEEFRARVMAL